jgi:hypothetical protein
MVPIALNAALERPLLELLLDSLRRMTAAGHRPGRYIVLRLTDGRVRAYALFDENSSPFEMIGQVRNESGPLSSAYLVGCGTGQEGLQLFVEDLLTRRRLERPAHADTSQLAALLLARPLSIREPAAADGHSGE